MYNALINTVGSVALRQNADKFPVPAMWSPFTHKPHSVNSGVSVGFDSVMGAYGEFSETVVLSGDFRIKLIAKVGVIGFLPVLGLSNQSGMFIAFESGKKIFIRINGVEYNFLTTYSFIVNKVVICRKGTDLIMFLNKDNPIVLNSVITDDVMLDQVMRRTNWGSSTTGDLYAVEFDADNLPAPINFNSLNATATTWYSSNYANDGVSIALNGVSRTFGSPYGEQSYEWGWNEYDCFGGNELITFPTETLVGDFSIPISGIVFEYSGAGVESALFSGSGNDFLIWYNIISVKALRIRINGQIEDFSTIKAPKVGEPFDLIVSRVGTQVTATNNGVSETITMTSDDWPIERIGRRGSSINTAFVGIITDSKIGQQRNTFNMWGNGTKEGIFDKQIITGESPSATQDLFGIDISRPAFPNTYNSSAVNENYIQVEDVANSVIDTSGELTFGFLVKWDAVEIWRTIVFGDNFSVQIRRGTTIRAIINGVIFNFTVNVPVNTWRNYWLTINAMGNYSIFMDSDSGPIELKQTLNGTPINASSLPMRLLNTTNLNDPSEGHVCIIGFFNKALSINEMEKLKKYTLKKLGI